MALIVQKYGGTSVANTERVQAVAQRVLKYKKEGHDVVVVLSAPAGMTDDLIKRANAISKNPKSRELDMLLGTGEQISIALLAMALDELGQEAISFTASQIGIKTTLHHTKAKITSISTEKMDKQLKEGKVVIVAGFQGINENDEFTTLGRGGSDLTAVALGVALKADCVEIYTDVDGVYTADPRIVDKPKKLEKISFDEMLELAATGAKVLHSRSVELGFKYGVPIHLRSSFDNSEGTLVCNKELVENKSIITGISHQANEAMICIEGLPDKSGVAASIFKKISDAGINIEIITQGGGDGTQADIYFVTKNNDFDEALEITKDIGKLLGARNVKGLKNLAMISLVGNLKDTKLDISSKILNILNKENVKPIVLSGSDIKISVLLEEIFFKKIVNEFHKKFIN